ncbi:MAG: UDP-N-acetylglucosamine 2-epimerase (non-hydrolyzing) [Methanobrevibacter sp.]|jgi:UDP-N-acetylglucosamine 2-epimerase (non-hydrolysing)|nr:UDP-N-acetylglucosamine 2-epimerase (non-hydrolyzing) [Candidatus Methanoflexus mossambicus]
MKIAIILGTRPEIIKMASVIDEIIKKDMELLLIHTGQHYDPEMSDAFFKDLKLPYPDYNIAVGSFSHGKQTAKMMEGIEEVLVKEHPDIVLVQGDTNAVLAGALVASKLHVPVGHVEAGLRSYDDSMPEEVNRKIADACSMFYFVPTEKSAINLSLEGIDRNKIHIAGNTIVDACYRNLKIAKNPNRQLEFDKKLLNLENIVTLTMHRAENVDNKQRLISIIGAISKLTEANIIFPIHPRTKKTLEDFGLLDKLSKLDHIHLIKPLGYLDFLLLLSKSSLVLTDSGGLQEEAITLNVPAITLRYNTERPETVDVGANILVGADENKIIEFSKKVLNDCEFSNSMKNIKNPYGNGNSGFKIIEIIHNSYLNGNLKITSPEDIMSIFNTKISKINEDINVSDFEDKNNFRIRIVYNGSNIEFPEDNLNLKNKLVVFDVFKNN